MITSKDKSLQICAHVYLCNTVFSMPNRIDLFEIRRMATLSLLTYLSEKYGASKINEIVSNTCAVTGECVDCMFGNTYKKRYQFCQIMHFCEMFKLI